MREEIAPSLSPPEGLDLDTYRGTLIARFTNPGIVHNLSQIAWDGSKKLPIRLLATMHDNLEGGRSIRRRAGGVAAWMRFLVRQAGAWTPIIDPMGDELSKLSTKASGDAAGDTALFMSLRPVFSEAYADNASIRTALEDAYELELQREHIAAGGAP